MLTKLDTGFTQPTRPYWLAWIFIFAFSVSYIAIRSIDANPDIIVYVFPLLTTALVLVGFGRTIQTEKANAGWWLPLFPLGFFMIWYVYVQIFGHFSLSAILFHFRYDLESNGVVLASVRQTAPSIGLFVILAVCWWKLARRSEWGQRLGKALFIPLSLVNPFVVSIAQHVINSYTSTAVSLSTYYHDPALISTVDGQRKNLVHIYLESTERTLWNAELFNEIAMPLKRLEAKGFSATNIDQAELMGWTLAGTVASSCGVPIFNLGAIRHNEFGTVKSILPAAFCLSDVLARDGYNLSFVSGADLKFAGTDRFLASHGFQTTLGYEQLREKYSGPYNTWGLNDDDVFDAAFDEIARYSADDKPYSVTITTIGGHFPTGHVSQSCVNQTEVMKQPTEIMRAYSCTNRLTEEFIDRLESRGLLDNTVVVVQSDHLAMRNELYGKLESLERRNAFIIIADGLAGKMSPTHATMMDAYPTILDALGYRLKDGRAALGVSLLSQEQPLAKRLGLGTLNKAILSNDALRDRPWGLKAKS